MIEINDRFRITNDSAQWIIQEKSKSTKKNPSGTWRSTAFYGKLEHAIMYIINQEFKSCSSLKEIVDMIEEQNSRIEFLFSKIKRGE